MDLESLAAKMNLAKQAAVEPAALLPGKHPQIWVWVLFAALVGTCRWQLGITGGVAMRFRGVVF